MSRDQVETVVRRLFDAHNRKDAAGLDAIFSAGYACHIAGAVHDAAARQQQIALFLAAAPDLSTRIDALLDGDMAAVRWTTRATITGAPVQTPLGPVQARGQQTEISGVNVLRVSGDQIAEEWISWDELSWLRQLGALPADG